jgi:hypothetical protein
LRCSNYYGPLLDVFTASTSAPLQPELAAFTCCSFSYVAASWLVCSVCGHSCKFNEWAARAIEQAFKRVSVAEHLQLPSLPGSCGMRH